jgi:hypothetical protein
VVLLLMLAGVVLIIVLLMRVVWLLTVGMIVVGEAMSHHLRMQR